MKIEIIETSNIDSLIRKVWLNSRPNLDDCDTEEILKIDAPINDFPSVILKITSTILEREIIASFRDHIMWATTSRINCPTEWNIPSYLYDENKEFYDGLMEFMEEDKRNGINQNEYRLNTPILAETSYMIKASPRLLIKITKHFEYLAKFGTLFENASLSFMMILIDLHIDKFYKNYRHVNVNPPIVNKDSNKAGDFLTIDLIAPFSLRTHLIRHNLLNIKDDIIRFIHTDIYKFLLLKSDIHIQINASKDIWEEIYRKRSCWLTHYGLWHKILNPVGKICNFDSKYLPCDKSCPYSGDAEVRYTKFDPGVPCPKYTNLHLKAVSMDTIQKMYDYVKDDNRPDFWHDIIGEIK